MDRIVIAGASIAGVSAARELRRHGYQGSIALIDQDPLVAYRRPEVSKGLLSGAVSTETMKVPTPADLDLALMSGATLEGLDPQAQTVHVADIEGVTQKVGYDRLVIATGSEARPSPFSPTLQRVHTLRTSADALAMKADLDRAKDVVIVGAGFIGLEVAAVARSLGKSVTVIEAAEIPLSRVLGDTFGTHIAQKHRTAGVNLVLGDGVARLGSGGDGTVSHVELTSGGIVPADVVLVAIGSRPATAWLENSGLPLGDGVELDETCAVHGFEGTIVAAGDVASWTNPLYERRMRVEHWTNAIEQAAYAARRIHGAHDPAGFSSAPYFWSDQFGQKIQSIGSSFGFTDETVLDQTDDAILVAYSRGDRLLSIAGMNAGTRVMMMRKHVLDGVPVDSLEVAA
ncbi:NAD(P)/FAD-dependent oxidoreductase [Microbacterium suwonense]|uniref:Ferredoxin reductase n=1 Tax=Microbacterium suwonense TaxID=683047 RepID=A0ABM8FUE0_9MICO|nr:FAD-dependent oxidoreductase [Microbacterium suwonense]BDZ39301.1 ferredoxin reductase [Microbacterium suwonense]